MHRTRLDGSECPAIVNSGPKELGASGYKEKHLQPMQIMDILDRNARLKSLQHYIADAEVEERRCRRDDEPRPLARHSIHQTVPKHLFSTLPQDCPLVTAEKL